ncbi:MAG: UDP-N-acetylmuramoyl-tripeptide--D-alanyl-D-alanine ligase [Bacteroidales bacterium]|nr:UDP-N-acetylmuramoyl-tripeptide--D-alanyl-D-alanine ligase [Bacteroidales bacterium]
MENLNVIFGSLLVVVCLCDMWTVFARDLMMLQQNSYRNERYYRWFSNSGESTNMGRVCCCVALLFLLVNKLPFFAGAIIGTMVAVWQFIVLLRRKYKKSLVWTARARRIFYVMWILALILAAVGFLLWGLKGCCMILLLLLMVSPVVLIGANDILLPVEKHINKKYYNEAASILSSMPGLKIIGITGSYGKTSTKHYLHRILSEHFNTTMTPGSFNTTMGVIRTVREYLRPYDEVFIVEMGAKQTGDIKEICDLVHPSVGIITAVGEQHLESFKSIENVQRTKFELADAIGKDGFVVLNNDFPYVASRDVSNTEAIRYGVNTADGTDFRAVDIEYSPSGTSFAIVGNGVSEPVVLQTKLVGECNVSNLLAAVIVALKLGVPTEKIKYAVSQLEQVEHRLNMKQTPAGITIIDDAFNSNPAGSKMALDVLAMMTGGKRIVITPGMIELGDLQETANREFGRHIASSADVAIIVGQYNRGAILAGIAGGPIKEENIHAVDSFTDAQALLQRIASNGDTVLYENDLPDTFN